MFDLSSSKLLILGIVALLVVGPKDLPILLRTIGKYIAMIRRQADEFRSQFNDAIRDTELEKIKTDMETMGADVERTMHDANMSIEKEISAANAELDASLAKQEVPQFGQFDDLAATAPPTASPATSPAPASPAPAAVPAPEKIGA